VAFERVTLGLRQAQRPIGVMIAGIEWRPLR
jgi:hypothetical protein